MSLSVHGNVHVVFSDGGYSVAAIYRDPTPPHSPAVHWFDQAGVDALFLRGG